MLFAGWEVRMVKNCDRGLEIKTKGCKYGKIFHELNNF